MKIMKYLGYIVLTAILLFAFVLMFSRVESRFLCSGEISSNDYAQHTNIYMKLGEYRWWVGLWSDSNAELWVELPNETVDYFGNVSKAEDQLLIYDFKGQYKGNFSTLSKALTITTSNGLFKGICKKK